MMRWMTELPDLGETRSGDLGTLELSHAYYILTSIFALQLLAWNLDGDVALNKWEMQKYYK